MKNFTRIFLLSAFLVVGEASRLSAQAPINDNCANATLLTPVLACNPTAGTTQNATNSNAPGNCGGGQHDVWYKFVATNTAHQIRVDGASSFDAVIGALNSCGGTTRPVGGDCADGSGDNGVEILNLSDLTVGLTYYIQVYDYYGNITATADFDICVRSAPPGNDECANATVLTPGLTCSPTAGTTERATSSNAAGDCDGDAQPDVWYSFVATSSTHQVQVDGVPSFDAKIGALTDCGGTMRPTGGLCTDGSGNDGVEILDLSDLTVGSTYYIQVYDYFGSITATADFSICVLTLSPTNDNCANAIMLAPSATCAATAGTTENATGNGQSSSCGTTQLDVWYKFVATNNIHEVRVDGSLLFDAVIGALISCGGTASPTGGNCTDGSGDNGVEILNLSGLTVGSTYYIQVYDFYGNTAAAADFDICVLSLPPANDNCTNATLLIPTAGCTATAGTTGNATGSGQGGNCGTTQPDVWYKFVATRIAHQVRVDGSLVFDAVIGALTACGGTVRPTGGNCQDNSGDDGVEILNLSGLTVGSTYYIQVYDFYGNSASTADFNICVVAPTPLPLELSAFTGEIQEHQNVLHWETRLEKNLRFHAVERSVDVANWQEIGRKNGLINSNNLIEYELEDRTPLAKAYYRLRSVDFDGQESVSGSVVLTRKGEQFGITRVFPSPTKDHVTVQFNTTQEESVTVLLFDITGRVVLEQTVEAVQDINELPLTLYGLLTGAYTVVLSNSKGISAPVRFVKH